jgi:hypothetical protein
VKPHSPVADSHYLKMLISRVVWDGEKTIESRGLDQTRGVGTCFYHTQAIPSVQRQNYDSIISLLHWMS